MSQCSLEILSDIQNPPLEAVDSNWPQGMLISPSVGQCGEWSSASQACLKDIDLDWGGEGSRMKNDKANVKGSLERSVSVRSFCCEGHFMKETPNYQRESKIKFGASKLTWASFSLVCRQGWDVWVALIQLAEENSVAGLEYKPGNKTVSHAADC